MACKNAGYNMSELSSTWKTSNTSFKFQLEKQQILARIEIVGTVARCSFGNSQHFWHRAMIVVHVKAHNGNCQRRVGFIWKMLAGRHPEILKSQAPSGRHGDNKQAAYLFAVDMIMVRMIRFRIYKKWNI
jgi:hypothetical protein